MMGPTKLGTIREQVRKAFKMSDAELFAWFNREMKAREVNESEPTSKQVELETLRLLRDALKQETKIAKPKSPRHKKSAAKQ